MTKEKIQKLLSETFTTMKLDNGDERIVFSDASLHAGDGTDEKAVHDAVSTAQCDSGLSFDFSDEIASRAADILADLDEWNNDDALMEYIDGAVPIYNYDLARIYASDAWVVDDAVQELGAPKPYDSMRIAALGWYKAINDMTYAMRDALSELIDDEDDEENDE